MYLIKSNIMTHMFLIHIVGSECMRFILFHFISIQLWREALQPELIYKSNLDVYLRQLLKYAEIEM